MELIAKTLGEILAEPDIAPYRPPILNHEPREPIGGRKWHLIHERDGGICWMCGCDVPKGTGEVDHVQPRSSFAADDLVRADRSDNLKTACVGCNQAKSNYVYDWAPNVVGVTDRCWECINPDQPYPGEMQTPAYCGSCGYSWVPDDGWLL